MMLQISFYLNNKLKFTHMVEQTNQVIFFFLTLTKIDILGNKKNSKIYGLHLTEINIIFLMYYTTRFLD